MQVEAYFAQLQHTVNACRVLQGSNIAYDKRGTYAGFIRGELHFIDGSMLHFREAVDTELSLDRLMYTYQYMSPAKTLIFRYDNTGHHKKLHLATYPHHKHEGSEEQVVASPAPQTWRSCFAKSKT